MHVALATPDSASLTRAATLTAAAVIADSGDGEMTESSAGVKSMLTSVDTSADRPSSSVTACLKSCRSPSLVTASGSGHEVTPVHAKEIVIGVLFQPKRLGAGVIDAAIDGCAAVGVAAATTAISEKRARQDLRTA